MKKFVHMAMLIGIAAVCILTGVFFQSCTKKEPLKIGAILALSGPGSNIIEVRDGIQLAMEEINKWGGINGRRIEMKVMDSKSDPEEAKTAFEKLESQYHPDLYMTALSSVSTALAPLAEQSEAPLICLVTSGSDITLDKKWVFRFYVTADEEVPPIIHWLRKLTVKRLGVLYVDDPYGNSVEKIISKKAAEGGITVVKESYNSNVWDFEQHIEKLGDTEAIYVVGLVGHIGPALKQLKKNGYNGYILATSGASYSTVRSLAEADGIYIAAPPIYNPDYPFARDLKKKFEERYKRPLNHQGANGYEIIYMLSGLLKDKEISRQNIRTVLASGFVYTGALGRISVKKDGHDFIFGLLPARIVDGKIQYEQ